MRDPIRTKVQRFLATVLSSRGQKYYETTVNVTWLIWGKKAILHVTLNLRRSTHARMHERTVVHSVNKSLSTS